MRLLALAVAALALAGCASLEAPPSTTTTPPTLTEPTASATEPRAVTVTVGETPSAGVPPKIYSISPARLELAVGVPVNLTLKNDGERAHDLVIDGLDVVIESIGGGESASVVFTPTKTGTFPMYCTIGAPPADHRSHGMAGDVVVS